MKRNRFVPLFALAGVLSAAGLASAQEATPEGSAAGDTPRADIINDEGGPAIITGSMNYTDPFFVTASPQPVILLEDQTGFVRRDRGYEIPLESQVLGRFTTDFFAPPVEYVLNLPIVPSGPSNDVDNDGEEDTGVQIYAPAMWSNTFGDPYLEIRDLSGSGWSGSQVTTRIDPNPEAEGEVIGGTYIVYAPDDQQGFPLDFGADGLLFTGDEEIVLLPEGYTIVNMDQEPFTFSREREPRLDLIEAEAAVLTDYSDLSYVDAFDAAIAEMRDRYSYTEFKAVDWDALEAEFRPRFQEATDSNDVNAYGFALRDFAWSIPDGHVGLDTSAIPALDEDFTVNTEGGYGMALRELSDGRVVVFFLVEEGPAAQAGIEVGAEITAFNGQPISDAISQVVPYSSPFSSEESRRYQQIRYLMAAPVDTTSEFTFQNPGGEAQTVSLTTIAERQSFGATSVRAGYTAPLNPIEFRILDSGLGYIQITTFDDSPLYMIQLWERAMQVMNSAGVPGIILDMRHNGGGFGFLADQMAAYFLEENALVGYSESYNEASGEFFRDEERPDELYVPPQEDLRYTGEVAIIVGQDCSSACEFFSDALQRIGRATIYGQYASNGLGGAIDYFIMPEGVYFQYTATREVDLEGNIRLEGSGVVPDVRIPITEESLAYEGDFVLDAVQEELYVAVINALALAGDYEVTEGGAINIGDTVTGEIAAAERVRYTLDVIDDATLEISLTDEAGELDTVVRVYDADLNFINENDDIEVGANINSLIPDLQVAAGDQLIIEVATYNDESAGEYTLTINDATNEPEVEDPRPTAIVTAEATADATGEATAAPTTEATVAPTGEATPEATVEPTIEATAPATPEATVEPTAEQPVIDPTPEVTATP